MINTLSGQVKIGNNPESLDPASVLELESNTRVLVITRVTDAQMSVINPLPGALAYNTDQDCLHYYDGTQWVNICEELDNSFTVSTRADYLSQLNPQARDSTVIITTTVNPDDSVNYNFEVAQITGANIVNTSINGASKLQDDSVTSAKLADGSVTLEKLADATTGQPGDLFQWNGINWTLINESALGITEKDSIVGNEVVGPTDATLLLSGAGSQANPLTLDVAPLGIDTAELADDAVTTTKIADGNVTDAKLDKTNIPLSGFGAAGAAIDLGNQIIFNIGDPTNPLDAVNLQTLNAAIADSEALDNDTDGTNELQDLELNTNILTLSNPATAGNQVDLTPYLDDTTLDEAAVDAFVANNGYLTSEIDGSTTNELQDLDLNTNILTLSSPATAGNQVDLTPYLDDTTLASTDITQVPASTNRTYDINSGTISFTNGNVGIGTTPTSTLQTGGSFAASIIRQNTDFSLDESHYTVILDPGVTSVTLPASNASNIGRIYVLKNRTGGLVNTSINYINSTGISVSDISNVVIIQSDGAGNWEQIN
ncbi:hypothetical protein MACH07_04430 [Flagellimonas marinaquae]|uniref:Uncharacterized protein n=2 Tax=Flagellimonas marinaquae TaxID=254955 RepID=A0AA48KQ02_9FLAO|nr:hypothetical protein MACH07_04430 [Allomuricauda aquimarina]